MLRCLLIVQIRFEANNSFISTYFDVLDKELGSIFFDTARLYHHLVFLIVNTDAS